MTVIGPSGGGKSTTVKLLQRFYDVTAGYLNWEGENLSYVDLYACRSGISQWPLYEHLADYLTQLTKKDT